MSLPQGWKLTEPAKPLPPGLKPAEPEPTQNYFADKARRLGRGLPELLGQTVAGLGSNVESAVELGQDALFSTAVKRGDLTPEQAAARRQEMDALLEQSAVMQGAEAVQDVGRQITAVGPKHVQAPDPARDQELGSAVISGATSLVPLLAAPGLAIPTYASMMGEQQRAEAEQMGADRSKQAQAQVLAAVTGAGSEALLGVPALLRSIGGAKILPQALGAVEHFIDRAVGRAVERQALARPVSQAIKTAGREGTQEGLEQIAQNVIAKDLVGYDPDRDRTEGAGMAALAGGIVGGGLGGITQAGNDQLQGQAHRDFATQLDTNKNVPEALKTLLLQQDQLLRGLRPAQMFPNGTPELPLPDGLERVQTERGTFHFNPEQTNADTIITLSKLGRENELLNLGRYSKADVETQAAAKGEPIGTVTERTPAGTEVRAAVATPSTAAQTAADMEGQKTPGNIVAPESTQQTLLQRLAATEQADTAAAQAAQEKENADRLARQLDADAKKKLFDNRLTAARRLATDPQADFAAINGAVTSLEDYANDNSLGLTLEQKQQALAELAGLRPRLEKLKPAHDAALDRRAAAAKELEQQAQAAKNARVRADNARIDAIESTGRDPDTGQIVELDKVPEAEFDQLDLEREQITLDAYEAELRRRESAAAQTNEAGFNLRDLFIGRSEHLAAAGLAGPLRLPTPATERARGGLGSELTTIMEGTVPWSYFDKTAAGLDSLAQTLRELGFKAETEDAALQLVQAAFNGQDVRPAGRVEFAQAKSLDAAGDRLAAARNGDSLPGNGTLGRSGRADFASELNPPAPAAPAALSDEQVQRQMSRLRNVLGPIAQDYNLQVGQVADLLEQAGHPREAAALRAGRFGQIEAAITTDLRAQINGLQAQRKLIVIAAQAAKQGKLTGLALHEIAHEFWRMLPAETQAALRRLHAQETGTKTGPLYQGGRLQTNIAVEAGQISPERLAANPDLPVLEWFAERVRALNTQWLDGKMAYAEDSTLRRVWRQLLDMLQRIVAQLKNQPQDSDLFTATFRQWLGTGQREHVAPQAVAYAQQIDKQLPAPDSAQHERAAQYVAKNGTPLAKQAEAERDIARLLAVAENDQAELFPYPLPTDTGRPAARRKRVSPGTLPDEVAARARQALTEPTNAAALEKAWADGDTISGVITALVANPARSWDIRGAKIATPQDLLTFTAVLRTPYVETLKVLLLNASQEVMHSEIVTVGSINSSLAPMRLIADVISRSPDPSAKYGVIMSHNHPSGDPTPSNADRQVTVELQRATQTLGHEFVDHVVTNGSKYYSFREMGATVASQGINRTRKRPAAGAHLDERADPSQPAPWETVPRTQRQPMQNEAATTAYLATARQIDPNALHVYFVNNKNYLVAVQRVSNYTDPAAVMPKIGLTASQAGATSFFIGFPDHVTAADVVRHLRLIREQTKMLGLELLDAVSSNLQGNARALGLVFESQAMFDMNTALGIDLPNEIRNLQPRWQTKPLEFESSLDKALYYAGGEGNTATRELIVRSLASQTTLSAGQIASLARELRAKLRNLANQTSTNATVRVPALMQKAVADLTGVEFAQAADAQATLQIDDVNLPADASHLMRQLAIFGRKFNALNRAVKSDRDPSLLNIYIKIAQRLQHQLLSEIGGMDESDLVQVVNAVQPDSAAAAIILRAAQSNAGWPSMALVYENGTISGGSAGSLVQERGKKSDYGALVRYEEDTRDHPEGRISRSWNTRSDRLQLSAFEIRGATRNELKLALWNDRVTLRHGQKTMEFPARELVRRALSEGRAEFLRSMTPEVSRLLMERSGQTPESFWRAVREGDVTLTNTLAQKPSRRRDQFKKAGRYVGPLPVTGTPQIAQATRYQEEQASIDFAQAADPTAARIQEIDARLAALQEGADQDGESAEAEGQALTEERAALVKQQQQAARDALVAATLVANEATPVSQAAKDNQHPAAQGTVPAGEAWAPVASLTDAELIKEQKAAGAHLSKNFSDLSNIERAQITQRLAVLEAEHARRTDEIIANAPRVTPITTPDRRTALLAELHRGRQLRDTGARDGSLEAEQEGIRIVRASTDRLNEEYPGWDAAAGNADAAQHDGRNLPPAPPAEPPEYAAPQGDEPPPNRGRAIELYGHSAHQPAFLQRAWNKIRPSLLGIRGSVPELPAFPAARWNKTDRFIKEHGPGFYNGLKEFWRALRSGNDYIQRTAEEQVAQITQPLLNLGTPFNADQYRRLQQLQEKVRVLKTEGRQPNARMAANLAALQSQLEAHPYVLFSRFVLLMDLNWRSQNLKDSQGQPIKMPAGLNTTEINAELQRLDQRIAAHPHAAAIAQAVEQHRALTKQVAEDLKARDLFAAEHLANPSYFPHLTLEVTQGDKVKQRELRPERVRPGTEADFRGYLIDPVGSLKPIETDYVRAMYYHLVQIGAHNFKADAIKNHARPYDVRSQVEARAKQLSRERGTPVSWEQAYNEEFAPAGYVLYGTDSRDAFPQLQIDRDKLARRLGVILTSEDIHQQLAALGKKNVRLLPEDLRETLVQGQREVWILPARVAEALRGIADRQEEQEVKRGNPMSASLAMWKAWKLFTPQNHVRYEFNNIVADVEKIFSATPGTFKKLGQSAQEIRAFYQGGRPNDDLRAALKAGVINAITAQEMGQLQRMKAFEKFQTIGQRVQRAIIARGSSALYQPVTNLLGLGQLSSVELSAFRESVTRYANYLANLEAIRHGARPEYAGAYWRDIEAIQDSEPGANDRAQRQAAQISKATFGDYGDLSVNGEWLRKNLVPFYSWMEVNFKYHANLLRNLRDMASLGEISRARAIAQGTAAIGGKAVGLGARTAAGVVTRLALPYAAMAMWNAFGGAAMGLWDKDDDLESQLSAEDRRRFHLILGRNPDGTLSVLYGATALADVMKWFSGPKFMQSMGDWLRGKTDFGTAVNDWAEQIRPDLLNTAAGGLGPVPKVAVALTLRKNVFPDVLDARTIPLYDLRRNILGQITDDFTADMIERTLNQDYVPSKAIGTWAKQLVLQSRRRDPEAWAFYAIKDQAAEFEYKQTGKRTGFADRDSPDQQVLRNFRRAIYQGDAEVAAKMYLRLLDYGYTSERFAASIRSQDPLSGIPKKDGLRQKFVQSLDADGRQQLARAFRYFGRMTSAKGTEKMLFPSDQDGPAGRAAARRQPRTQLLKKIMALQAQEPEAAAQKRAQFQLYQSLMPAR